MRHEDASAGTPSASGPGAARGAAPGVDAGVDAADGAVVHELRATVTQAGFLAARLEDANPRAHVEQVVLDGPAPLMEPARLADAWRRLTARHETLRLALVPDDEGWFRLDAAEAPLALTHRDLSDLPPPAQEEALARHLEADRQAGVDPTRAPGWRVALFDLSPARRRMVWTIHHALIDGDSLVTVLGDLWRLLSEEALPPAGPGLRDALAARRLDPGAARAAFAAHLSDRELASEFPARPVAAGPMAERGAQLPPEAAQALRRAAEAAGVTVLTCVQAAWALVLARWTGRPGAGFGLVESGRGAGTAGVAGCLIATLPFEVRLDDLPDLGALLARLRRQTLALRPHAHAGQSLIRHWAGRQGGAALYDTVLLYQRRGLADALAEAGCGWSGVRLLEEGTALMSLSVFDGAADRPLRLSLEHDRARLPEATAARVLAHVARLLEEIATAAPDTPLSRLEMLSPDEVARLRQLGQPDPAPGTAPDAGPDAGPEVPDLMTAFARVVAAHPRRPAVIDAATGATTDFATLDAQANALAWRLSQAAPVAGAVVAVALPRSTRQVTAMLAVRKAGAAFLMLDPGQPGEYLAGLCAQAGAVALIADRPLPLSPPVPHVLPDAATRPAPPPVPPAASDALAYIAFTSGSTGRPKAVRGLNGALAAHARAMIAAYGLTPADRVLQFAAPSFDVYLEETWPTLLAGAAVVLRDEAPLQSIAGLLSLVARHGVSVLNLPASYWHQMVAELRDAAPPDSTPANPAFPETPLPETLRLVVTGSERVSPSAYRAWRAMAPGLGFVNAYGPAEATVTSTLWHGTALPEGEELPIGRPAAHARIALRAADGALTPPGGEGQIWIGGRAVTGGYLDEAAASARAFGPDPDDPGGRAYASGDLGRWSEAGQLMFLGRADRQVKLRGHRIELGQIEAVLSALPGVSRIFVDLDAGPPARLLAWLVTEPGTEIAAVAAGMRGRLPSYMIPRLIEVAQLPVTANGKIDRDRLPRPGEPAATRTGQAGSGQAGTAPTGTAPSDAAPSEEAWDPQVRAVAACMAEVLGRERVGASDDFYDLGGDSLLSLRLSGLIRARTGLEMHAADLMTEPSPEGLTRLLRTEPDRSRYLVPTQPLGAHAPLIAVHVLGRRQELYRPLSEALGPDYPVLGMTIGVPEDGREISVETVAQAYLEELERHVPGRPLCLIAVSMAAYFALELAQRLRAAGRMVPVLIVLDAAGPGGRAALTGWARLCAHLGQLRRRGPAHLTDALRRRLTPERVATEELIVEKSVDVEALIQANVRAVQRYRPRPYDGPIAIFRAADSFWDAPEALRTGLGWSPVAAGGWVLHDLPGAHLSILEPGHVDALADHLRPLIPLSKETA